MSEVNDMDRRENKWSLDKKIPISLIFALLMQTVAFVIYSTRQDGRIGNLEERRLEDRAAITALALMPERMIKLEMETMNLKTQLTEMRSDIKQLSIDISRREARKP
ncbi:hypothetical protein LG200_05095 [Methylobacillus caricis]|uniref:hypothetical protein n=1 Tax=Methylobacillus caricis TaxID=1971611 RepID=UPI001CFF6B0B|nr:hypothetical protein [Methylobacillus caricis]MCB5187380.1 hypothetical protein [Methylobacillus caricis]